MAPVHSKYAVSQATKAYKRSNEAPIPFIPQHDPNNVVKPREIKVPLRSNPAQANSAKIEKIFLEFVESTPESYCRWRGDVDEYANGTGVATAVGKLKIAMALLGQQHKETWENIVSTTVPAGQEATDENYTQIMEQFALNFMSPTARRLQKRYMLGSGIEKPRNWSARMVANRLNTLARYLQYLPGTAGNFTPEELKDMLVDIHPAVYQEFITRANYNVDDHSYIELTNYLQNLALVERIIVENGHPGNSEENKKVGKQKYVKKAGVSFHKDKNRCRKHPHHNHTWDECRQNPKNAKKTLYKNKANPKEAKTIRQQEVRVTETEPTIEQIDSDAEMDVEFIKSLGTINLTGGKDPMDEDQNVSTQKISVQKTRKSGTNPTPLDSIPTVRPKNGSSSSTCENLQLKAVHQKRNSTSRNLMSNKKQRLLNKHLNHECLAQSSPLERKFKYVDSRTPGDLTTEIIALAKNITGKLPVNLHRVLIDTGCSKTIVKSTRVPAALLANKRTAKPITWKTNGGDFHTKHEVPLTLILPEFSPSMEVEWSCAIDENPNATYDMIIGRDLQHALQMDILWSTGSLSWNGMTIPMRAGQQKTENLFLEEILTSVSEPDILQEALYEATRILDSDYKKANLNEVAENIPHLSEADKSKIKAVLYRHESLFEGKLGLWDTAPITLELEPDVKPFHARAFPVPQIHESTLRKEVDRLCLIDVLEKCADSEWAAPTFIVPKKEGTVRFITDFRQLNKCLKRKPYPMPNIQDILQKLGGFTYATALDLNMGYYNIRLDLASSSLCTLVLPWGKYRYKRLPMGIKNSPDIFQEKINELMEGLEEFIRAYLDDILIITKGSFEDHLEKVSEVFSRLQKAGLQVNVAKSKFAVQELEYLGFWLTPQGIRPMAKKVEAIKNLQAPKTVKQVRSLLGMINYYKDMWRHRSHLLTPLTDLTANKDGKTGKKRGPIKWEQIHQDAFEKIKQIITDNVMLSFPDFNKPFEIHTDASDYQLGSVIMQDQKPIAFYSRKLNAAQRNYTTGEREMLSIVETLRAYRNILLGHEIIIFTDHKNLVNDRTRHESSRIQRWIWLLEEFGPKFKYLKGEENPVADALSRLNTKEPSPNGYENPATCFATLDSNFNNPFREEYEEHLAENVFSGDDLEEIIYPLSAQTIKEAQRKDRELLKKLKSKPEYSDTVLEGTDLITYRDRIYIPQSLRPKIVEWYHTMLGHPGTKRTAATIAQHLIWPGLHNDVDTYIMSCNACQLYKGQRKKYGHLPVKDIEIDPWKTVCVDLIGPYTIRTTRGVQSLHAMTMFDPATSWFEVAEIPNKKAITCANIFENNWLCRYPRPKQCIFDNGSEFLGADFTNTLDSYGIKRIPTTIKNPAANMVERVHQTLGNLLRVYELEKFEFPKGDPWSNILASAAWAIRSTIHTTLGATPGQLIYGRDMLFDLSFKANWHEIRQRKKQRIEESNKKENSKRIPHTYRVGDLVSKDRNVIQPKLHKPRDGPYRIEKVYTNGVVKIRNGVQLEKVSIRRIHPYHES